MSEGRKGEKNHRYGKPMSEEQKKKLAAHSGKNSKMYGRKPSEEAIRKMSAARKGKKRPNGFAEKVSKALMGHKHSEETLALLSQRAKERARHVIDTATGIEYSSAKEAAKHYNKTARTLYDKLKGKFKNDTTFIYKPL